MKNKLLLSIFLAISIFIFTLMLDFLTKGLIISNLIPSVGDRIGVIPKFISFIYVRNTGAAWGILGGRPVFLIIMSILILGLFITYYVLRVKKVKNNSSCLLGISVGLIAGGCIGNLFDRIVFGYVRDFINFDFMNFPVFNFADVALTFGVIIMIVYFLFYYSKEEKTENRSPIIIEKTQNDEKIDENNEENTKKDLKNENSLNEDENEGWVYCRKNMG